MKQYSEVLSTLENALNGTLNKKNAEIFLKSIKELKINFGQTISTKFLRNLIIRKSNRIKTYRVSYFLKKSGINTYKENRYFREWILKQYEVDIIEYFLNKKGEVFIKDTRNQTIGNFSPQNNSEVLHFVKV